MELTSQQERSIRHMEHLSQYIGRIRSYTPGMAVNGMTEGHCNLEEDQVTQYLGSIGRKVQPLPADILSALTEALETTRPTELQRQTGVDRNTLLLIVQKGTAATATREKLKKWMERSQNGN